MNLPTCSAENGRYWYETEGGDLIVAISEWRCHEECLAEEAGPVGPECPLAEWGEEDCGAECVDVAFRIRTGDAEDRRRAISAIRKAATARVARKKLARLMLSETLAVEAVA